MESQEVQLRIDAFSPDTLPMLRLAEYLKPFAQMIGSEDNVHFSAVAGGSAALVAFVEPHAVLKVKARTESLADGTAPKHAVKAFSDIDNLLVDDNATAEVFFGTSRVMEFPGRRRRAKEEFGPVRRSTTIDGQIFSIGGKDETVNVHLRDAEKEFRCVVTVEMARRLAPHLLASKLRLSGHGNWYRIDSVWQMRTFNATDFVVLEDVSLAHTLTSIQKVFEGVSPDEFMATLTELREG